MKAATRYLALAGLGLAALAQARPEEAWRALQRGELDRGAAPAHPAAAPQARPSGTQGGFGGSPRGAPQGSPAPAPQAAPQRQPGGFSSGPPGGHGPGNGGGNWRNDDRGGNRDGFRAAPPRTDNWRGDGNRYDGNRNDDWRNDGSRRDFDRDGDRDGRRHSWSTERGRNYYDRSRYDSFRSRYFRNDGGRWYARTRYHLGAFYWPRGYGARLWFIGEWLPSAFFYNDSYYLYSYWSYGLYAPPFGCRWIRVGDDALLVDEYSGEILDVIYNLFW